MPDPQGIVWDDEPAKPDAGVVWDDGPDFSNVKAGSSSAPMAQFDKSRWLARELGAVGQQPYGEGAGYAIDNPVTRGLAQAANSMAAGTNELLNRVFVKPVSDTYDYFRQRSVSDLVSPQPTLEDRFRKTMIDPLTQEAQQLQAPEDAGIAGAGVQALSNIGGQISMGSLSGGPVRTAATLGALQAGDVAAQKDSEGQPMSNLQVAGLAAANTASNMIPVLGKGIARVPAGAASGVVGNELSNLVAGNPVGTGDVQAGLFGGLLGAIPNAHVDTEALAGLKGPEAQGSATADAILADAVATAPRIDHGDVREGNPAAEVGRAEAAVPLQTVPARAVPEEVPVQPWAITQRFAESLADHPAAVERYATIPDSMGGTVLNTDIARELSPDYLSDRTKSADVHEPASAFVKKLYADKLAEPTPQGYEPKVVFTAGGTGAGKTTGLRLAGEALGSPEIVYDTNMNTFESAKSKIEQALNASTPRDVTVLYTYRDPAEALRNGALKRATRQEQEFGTGRTVPMDEHLKTHLGAYDVVNRLAEEYNGDPRVSIIAVDNSRGQNKARIVPLEEIPNPRTEGLNERLQQELHQAHAAGEISDAVRAGFEAPASRVEPEGRRGFRQGLEQPAREAGQVEDRGPSSEPLNLDIPFESLDAAPSRVPRRLLDEEARRASQVRSDQGPADLGREVGEGSEAYRGGDLQQPAAAGRSIAERVRAPGEGAIESVSEPLKRNRNGVLATQGGFIGAKPPTAEAEATSGPPHPGLPENKAPNFQYVHDALANLSDKRNARIVRDVARRSARSAWAEAARSNVRAANAVETAGAHFDRRPKELRADPMQAMADVIAYQKGGTEAVKDPMAHAFFKATEGLLNEQVQKIRSFGKGYLEDLRNNYFRQEWEEPQGTKPTSSGLGRRPLGGNKSFTKERVFDTFEDGIKAGYKPKFDNPVDFFLSRYASGEKLLASLRIMKDLEDRGAVADVKQGDRVPIGFARVNDPAFNGKVVPELVANDLNNHLSPGFNQYKGWRTFRAFQNRLISARLGISAFHAGLTTLDTFYTHASLGLQRVAIGDLRGGFHELANTLVSPIMSPIKGKKLLDQFYGKEAADPQTAAILELATRGGARGRMTDSHPEFNDDYGAVKRALSRGEWGTVAKKGVPALMESVSRPMLQYLVPYQKMISRVLLLKFELDKVAHQLGQERGDYKGIIDAAHPDFLDEIAKRVDDDVSNRLGQHTYDNYFWNRHLRDMLHAGVTSVGWNQGWLNFIVGGVADLRRIAKPEKLPMPLDKAGTKEAVMSRITTRTAYLATMNAIHFALAAGIMKAMTDQWPEDFRDLYYPRTGRKNNDGTDERLALPDFVKEQYAITHHPLETAKHKLHPSWSMAGDFLENKDFYGTQVYDPEADIPEQVKDVLKYLGKSFLPYSYTGAQKNAKSGASPTMMALPFVGVTPASGAISKSDFQAYVDDKYFDTMPRGARRQEAAERSAAFNDALAAKHRGEVPDTSALTDKQKARLRKEGDTPVWSYRFTKLDPASKVHAYNIASPEERSQYKLRNQVLKAINNADIPGDEKRTLRERME